MANNVIETRGLTVYYGNHRGILDVNLSVEEGEVFGFLGPNGAGKSTTIRMLLSLISPKEGSIKIFGKSLVENRNSILSNVGAIIESPDFYNYLSAYKNLEILGRISGKEVTKKRVMEMLELVGLKDRYKSKVKTFSHGMKQRLGIAQALLHNPDLIILDEPTVGLDPQGMKEIRDLINRLSKEEKKTIFLSSHILSEVELVANRMTIINKGKTIVEGKVEELLDAENFNVTFEIDDVDKAKQVLNTTAWLNKIVSQTDKKLVFSLSPDEIAELNKYLVENNLLVSAVVPTRSLEEYFLSITRDAD